MAELYKKFTSLYPYPHLRIAPGAPSSYIHHLYLNRLADGRTYGLPRFWSYLTIFFCLLSRTIYRHARKTRQRILTLSTLNPMPKIY